MSDSHLNNEHTKKIRKAVKCLNNGVVYKSMSSAAKELGVAVSNVCNVLKGKRKHTMGYTFEYVRND